MLINTLTVWTFSYCNSIWTAAKLICIARTTFKVGSICRSESVWTATMLSILTTTSFIMGTTCNSYIIRTTSKSRILTSTTIEIWTSRWGDIIRATFKGRREAASITVRSMSWRYSIITASESWIFTWCMASLISWTKC